MKLICTPPEENLPHMSKEMPLSKAEVDMYFFTNLRSGMCVDFYCDGRWRPGLMTNLTCSAIHVTPKDTEKLEYEDWVGIPRAPTLVAPYLSRSKPHHKKREERRVDSLLKKEGPKRIRDALKHSNRVIPLNNLLYLPQ